MPKFRFVDLKRRVEIPNLSWMVLLALASRPVHCQGGPLFWLRLRRSAKEILGVGVLLFGRWAGNSRKAARCHRLRASYSGTTEGSSTVPCAPVHGLGFDGCTKVQVKRTAPNPALRMPSCCLATLRAWYQGLATPPNCILTLEDRSNRV